MPGNDIKNSIVVAVNDFELEQHHELIYDNPNILISKGFPAFFLLPLLKIFESSNNYVFHRNGILVEEMIGISHFDLVMAIADILDCQNCVPDYVGRGFIMGACIEEIKKN